MSIIAVTFLLSVSAAAGYFIFRNQEPQAPEEVACAMDAMICPDGSSAGRTGPNCEFAPCPTTAPIAPELTEIPTMSPTPTIMPLIPGWNTYQDAEYGFSFSYPANLTHKIDMIDKYSPKFHLVDILFADSDSGYYSYYTLRVFISSVSQQEFNSHVANITNNSVPYSGDIYSDQKNINVAGISALTFKSTLNPEVLGAGGALGTYNNLLLYLGGNQYWIAYKTPNSEKQNEEFNQILSTLKFTN